MLDRVTIAAPCHADWESMSGTDRVRHCGQCDKNVYNLSAMTRREAEALLRQTEGRLCTRFYRRADGTIITENCPEGLRAIGRRISRVAGAAMSAAIALSSATAAHLPLFQITLAQDRETLSTVTGTIQDATTSGISQARVEIKEDGSGKSWTTRTDNAGQFRVASLPRGSYTIRIESPGFRSFTKQILVIMAREYQMNATLDIGSTGGPMFDPPARPVRRKRQR